MYICTCSIILLVSVCFAMLLIPLKNGVAKGRRSGNLGPPHLKFRKTISFPSPPPQKKIKLGARKEKGTENPRFPRRKGENSPLPLSEGGKGPALLHTCGQNGKNKVDSLTTYVFFLLFLLVKFY